MVSYWLAIVTEQLSVQVCKPGVSYAELYQLTMFSQWIHWWKKISLSTSFITQCRGDKRPATGSHF